MKGHRPVHLVSRTLRLAARTGVAASVLIALAAGGLWVRSATTSDALILCRTPRNSNATRLEQAWVNSIDGHLEMGATFVDGKYSLTWNSSADGLRPAPPRLRLVSWPASPQDRSINVTPGIDGRFVPWHVLGFYREVSLEWRGSNFIYTQPSVIHEHYGIPYWAVAAVALVPPLICLRGVLRKRRRRANGCCVFCGFDLRASRARCPECGTPTGDGKRARKRGAS